MSQDIQYGDPCKRCGRPMVPRHATIEPGYVEHMVSGFCNGCRQSIARRTSTDRSGILDGLDGIVDTVAVERASNGERDLMVTLAELAECVRHLRKLDLSDYDIAFTLGMPLSFVRGELATVEAVAA